MPIRHTISALLLALTVTGCTQLRAPEPLPELAATPPIPAPVVKQVQRPAAPAQAEVEAVDDVWQEIRSGLGLQHEMGHDRVTEKRERYLAQRVALLQVERTRYYLPFIVAEVQARGLPLELALLPFVESSLDPYAFSHGGAAGLWQLMPATARYYGVEIDWWYDGRRDIVESTAAALTYLEHLHAQFDDWLIAIAAYNAGQGRIRGALRQAGTGATYWDLRVPAETARFVPRLLALAALVAAPDDFGFELPPLQPGPNFVVAELGQQLDLTRIAEVAEMPVNELFLLNAGLNHGTTPPRVPHRVLIPVDYLAQFEDAVAQQPATAAAWGSYSVQRGDTLARIAQRHGTSVAELTRANALNGHLIRPGQRLRIPQPAVSAAAVPANPILQSRAGTTRYRVRSGDSLWTISRRFNTSVDALVRANRLDPSRPLQIGQQLAIPPSGRPAAAVAQQVQYRVQPGDSLSAIAARFDVTVRQLVSWNRLDRNSYLQPGQRLLIRVSG
jgi:membrane-bound lytic murein transglycosylase D